LGENPAQLDAGYARCHRADDATELGRGGHFRVEGFDVGRTASEPEPDDRGVFRGFATGSGGRPSTKQVGQQKGRGTEAEGADFEEVAARGAVTVGPIAGSPELEHDRSFCNARAPRLRSAGGR